MERMNIPKELDLHLREAMLDIAEDPNIPEHHGIIVGDDIEDVPHEGYDGFIPFTNGGYVLTLLTDLSIAEGSGSFPSSTLVKDELEKVIAQRLADALATFIDDNITELSKLFSDEILDARDDGEINYHTLNEMGQGFLAEQLSETEHTYLSEGGAFFYQFKVLFFAADNSQNLTGEDELFFFSGTNLDFEYGRDKGLILAYEKTIKLSELTVDVIDDIVIDMSNAI